MTREQSFRLCVKTITACVVLVWSEAFGEVVPVRHVEGELHGFVSLSTLEGKILASGDSIQTSKGGEVTSRLLFHFRDGSVHDETAVFTQRQEFHLVRYRLIQKGPSFKDPIDVSIECSTGQATVHYSDHGEQKTISEHVDLPADLANGLVPVLLKNLPADAAPLKLSMLVATPKLRMVKLAIGMAGEDPFSTGGLKRKARHYVVKVELGGLTGVVAPIVGKQPPDTHVWILGGEAPEFIKSEGPLAEGLPAWRIELERPVFPRAGK
jgi:hypothetical protein